MPISPIKIIIPADVPQSLHDAYQENYSALTAPSGHLVLFAGDQKIEHLNVDFNEPNLPKEIANPEHLFKIAAQGQINAFATQLGLIARYGKQFEQINYIAKLNSKTNLVPTHARDPLSLALWNVADVVKLKKESKLAIRGIGYTVYLGSIYESQMLTQAAQCVYQAHQEGLVAILWMYPRGSQIIDEHDADLIAGAAGVAACLGADFAKINPPMPCHGKTSAELLREAVRAAGNTGLICSGGKKVAEDQFLTNLYEQIHSGGLRGSATGRNIFQRPLEQAITYTKAIFEIVHHNKRPEEVL